MTGNKKRKNKEDLLSQFIDELNQEKKPSIHGMDTEDDQELYQLLDTVRAVKRLKDEEVPEIPEFNGYNGIRKKSKLKKGNGFWKYGAIAACLLIAVAALIGKTGNKDGFMGSANSKNDSLKLSAWAGNSNHDAEAYADNKLQEKDENSLKQSGYSEDITTVYTSCSAAAVLLEELPESLRITSVVKLEDSPYTYRVSCSWDKESFMDIYILPGVEGYGMDYQSNCYSFMDGIIQDNTDEVTDINEYYGEAVSTLSWSGDGFTIMIVSDRECDEVRSMLEKITGSKSAPINNKETDK